MKRKLLVALMLVMGVFMQSVIAQVRTVSGQVTDESGMPLPGVSVVVKNTSKGVSTDFDGKYSLQANQGDVLEFSYIGFATQTKKVMGGGNSLIINAVLKEETEQLGEVVVTALGVNKQARSVGYATTKVDVAEIGRLNVVNPVNALQGKVAGVAINNTGASGVTSSAGITIRGAKSLDKNNSPIFVVDGMIIQENLVGALGGTDWGSQLKNLNPADYESITVLKGAAATALYGSRGANGAIVIVSKGGKYGKQGLGVEFSQSIEMSNIYAPPMKLQNLYGAGSPFNGYEGGFLGDGSLENTPSSFGPKMEGQLINQYMPSGEQTPFVAHPDNWRVLYRNPFNQTYNVAINGGGENSSFRLSYSYMDNNGSFKRNNFNRNTVSFKGLMKLNNIFSMEAGVNYAFSEAKNAPNQYGGYWDQNQALLTTLRIPRNFDMKTYEATYRDPITQAVETDTPWSSIRNYLHIRDLNLNQRNENSLLANLTLRANIASWLTASVKGNYNYYSYSTMSKSYGTGAFYGPTKTGEYSRGGKIDGSYNFLGMLQSNNNKINIAGEEITLDAIVAAELYGNLESHSWSKSTKGGLVVPGLFAFSNSAETIIPSFGYTPANNKVFGVSGILNLGWRDQLFLEVTGRNDWLSSLTYPNYMIGGKNNYSVFYPSVNSSWVFTETFQMPDWFSFGKVRASWAEVGMGTGAYASSKGYGIFKQESQFDANRNSVLVARPNLGTAWNNDLKPEIQRSIELGTDLRFFNDRLNIDFAYYKTNTRNQILSVGTSIESGASTQLINAGNIQNQGIELQIEGTPIRTNNFRWTIGTNITKNKGKIVELHPNVKEWQIMGQTDAGAEIWAYEGGDYGVLTSAYNAQFGSAIYRFNNPDDTNDPRNGKPVIYYAGAGGTPNRAYAYIYRTNTQKNIKDRVVLGKVEADFYLNINTSFSYKNFDLYALIDGRFGGQFYSNANRYATSSGALESTLQGRDAEHGGLPRVNYKGETVYDAIMLDAVFDQDVKAPLASDPSQRIDVGGLTYKEALDRGIAPMMASTHYYYNYRWGAPVDLNIQENTWLMLREISVGYRFDDEVCKKIGMNYLRVGLTARNLGLLMSKLQDGLNPESLANNNPLQPVVYGGVPYSRTFSFNLTARF
ncbi:SusC/RagA family TonB-linked outer membrane protein [Capnocytophaga canimorsus]|uniref:SusC/RagA family TonB-linked outer membrane protein n=1 Tax=Capnocytophaga canimorsus TaxID=28188 RepID=A0A250G2K4_9FLAO|nr:SusC/RagA family TonB-linked outer membrane protein [Capnocytophaga canimorsus]ATA91622.1 SusC/RagA family TonB-linked outer membrane protein [Capnocytophaga canimorsus]